MASLSLRSKPGFPLALKGYRMPRTVTRSLRTGLLFLLAMLAVAMAPSAWAQTIVNLDAIVNATGDATGATFPSGKQAITVSLAAGSYDIVPIGVADGGAYDGFVACTCNPIRFWVHDFTTSEQPTPVRNGAEVGYATGVEAIAHAPTTRITLAQAGWIKVFLVDNPISDNAFGLSMRIVPVGSSGGGTGTAQASAYFSERFAASSLDAATLRDVDSAFVIASGAIRRSGLEAAQSSNRHYVTSAYANFLSLDWTYEVSVSTPVGGQDDILFIGLGEGVPSSALSNEPRNGVNLRIHRGSWTGGRVDIGIQSTGGWTSLQTLGYLSLSDAGFKARLVKSGASLAFEVIGATQTLTGTVDNLASAAPFLGAGTARLYFGNASGVYAFSNLSVTSPTPLAPAPTVTLSASPASVQAGDLTTLFWTSSDATSCTAGGSWSGTQATSGALTTAALLFSSNLFRLTCAGPGGSASASVEVLAAGGIARLPVLVDAAGLPGLDTTLGQRRVRLAPFRNGRVAVAFAQGYSVNCGLFSGCSDRPTSWHLVVDGAGAVSAPQRTWADLDTKPGINTGTTFPATGDTFGDGSNVVFALSHSGHNSLGGNFVRMDSDGNVLARLGGTGSYGADACVIGTDVILSSLWVDPVTNGMQWWTGGNTLAGTSNFGGYGYNYNASQALGCGRSLAMGGPYAIIARMMPASHVGLTLYSAPGPTWTQVGTEVRLPTASAGAWPKFQNGRMDSGDDKVVVLFRDAAADGRVNLYFGRYRITASGLQLLDATPIPIAASAAFEGLDGAVTYGGDGMFYVALYQAGTSASGQPTNTRQAVSAYRLDFDSGQLTLLAPAYEDGNWTNVAPLDYYGASANVESYSIVKSCDGALYIGGGVDSGAGRTLLKVFRLVVEPATCGGPPVLTPVVNGSANAAGWYTGAVSVSWDLDLRGFDEVSRTGCEPLSFNSDTAGSVLSCSVTTVAGTATQSVTIKRDATPPTAAFGLSPLPNGEGWNRGNVTVSFSGTDAASGVVSCSPGQVVSTEGADQSSTDGTCTDQAGHESAPVHATGINIDKTAPMVSASTVPLPNGAGWNNSPVTVAFSASDVLSGVAIDGCDLPVTLSAGGVGQSATGTCRDRAGNEGGVTRSGINIDLVSPTATAVVSPASNAANWHRSAATVAFYGTDSLSGSGIQTCTPAQVVATEGAGQVAGGRCQDAAGNQSALASATVNLDLGAPSTVIAAPANGATYVQGSLKLASYSCSDTVSGIASCTGTVLAGSAFATDTIGAKRFSVAAADVAGNQSVAWVDYTVVAPVAAYTVSPATVIFGNQGLGVSVTQTVLLASTGGVSLPITGIVLAGLDANQFSRTTTCGASVPATGSCAISVTFRPTTAGNKTASLVVSAGASAGSKTVSLSGTGVMAAYGVNPTSLGFPNTKRYASSAAQRVAVVNLGSVALPLTRIAIKTDGDGAAQFAYTTTCGASVAVGSSCGIDVVFRPTKLSLQSADLVVSVGAGAAASTVRLRGTGT